MVTIIKEKQERSNMEMFTRAPSTWKCWTFSATKCAVLNSVLGGIRGIPEGSVDPGVSGDFLLSSAISPPQKKDIPSTKSMLERTEPNKVALTKS
mmetsp:Transcript_57492/g.136757  ORF Transcript_57492/g.136757 Transcript_57492/m.136757 type:complete len:95 (+) Transcript_57492:719-1003(+)